MIGLVIATHSRIGEELLNAARMIFGKTSEAQAVSIRREDSMDAIQALMDKAVAAVGVSGDGVLVLTDMFGGTPSNIGLTFLDPGKVEVLTGVNLPMVLKFFNRREKQPLSELAAGLKVHGQDSITLASDLLQK